MKKKERLKRIEQLEARLGAAEAENAALKQRVWAVEVQQLASGKWWEEPFTWTSSGTATKAEITATGQEGKRGFDIPHVPGWAIYRGGWGLND